MHRPLRILCLLPCLLLLYVAGCSGCRSQSIAVHLAAVKMNGKWGYVDKTGKMVIQPQFDAAWYFSEGLAAVESGGKWGFIDAAGKMVIAPQFDSRSFFHDGVARISSSPDQAAGKKYGFIDKKGRYVVQAMYDEAYPFHDGLAAVKSGELWGFIDAAGKVVIKPQFQKAGSFYEGLAAVATGGTLQQDGTIVGEKWGYIDVKGQFVIPAQFTGNFRAWYTPDKCMAFSEGLAAVMQDGKWGYIDKTGRIVITAQYDLADPFTEGYAYVETWRRVNEGLMIKPADSTLIDKTGKIKIVIAQSAGSISDGLVPYLTGTKGNFRCGYLDVKGNVAIQPQFDMVWSFADGMALIGMGSRRDRKFGFIDKTGKVVIPAQYEAACGFAPGDWAEPVQ